MLHVRPSTVINLVSKPSKYTVEKFIVMDGSTELSKATKTHEGLNPTSGNLRITMAVNEWQIDLPVILTENILHFNSHSRFAKFQVVPEFTGTNSG
jgi:hypothetical protein